MANRSGSSTNSETDNLKWQLREKDAQILRYDHEHSKAIRTVTHSNKLIPLLTHHRLEAECAQLEQRNLEESNVRNVATSATRYRCFECSS